MRMLDVDLCKIPHKDQVNSNQRGNNGDGGVNFTMANSPDTVVLQFAALVLTTTVQEALDEDEDNIELVVHPPLSPRKPNRSPARRDRRPYSSRASFLRLTHPTRERRAFTTAFKLGSCHCDIWQQADPPSWHHSVIVVMMMHF